MTLCVNRHVEKVRRAREKHKAPALHRLMILGEIWQTPLGDDRTLGLIKGSQEDTKDGLESVDMRMRQEITTGMARADAKAPQQAYQRSVGIKSKTVGKISRKGD